MAISQDEWIRHTRMVWGDGSSTEPVILTGVTCPECLCDEITHWLELKTLEGEAEIICPECGTATLWRWAQTFTAGIVKANAIIDGKPSPDMLIDIRNRAAWIAGRRPE